jgi:putative spermidine/putrescine transport system substrate-binding protein
MKIKPRGGKSFATLLVMLFAAVTVGAQSGQLVVNSYGGQYEDVIRETIIEPFEEEFGVEVVYDAVGSAAEDFARIRATRGNPGFDVVVMTAPEALQGCREELLTPLTTRDIPNLARLNRDIRDTVGDCGAVHELQYMSLLYRTDRVSPAPTSWQALWDDSYAGHVLIPGIRSIMAVYLLQVTSVMEGGSLFNLDPGFEAIAELAPKTVAIEASSSVMSQYVERDEAWILPFWSGRAELLKKNGLPVDYLIPEEGTIPLLPTLSVPANARNKDLAFEFINFWLAKERQEAWALAYNVGSARSDLDLPADFAERQITSQEDLDSLLLPNQLRLSEQRSGWTERWQRTIRR